MTSDRAIDANRRNAQASTGPRTRRGKTQSRQNARKHGLAAAAFDPHAEAATEYLAELIAGDFCGDPPILEAAYAVAEAQCHLRRVLVVKGTMIREDAEFSERHAKMDGSSAPDASPELLQALERLERYERRAFSLRKSAIRRFEDMARRARRRPQDTAVD
ncbi:hypothetical protein FV222_08555 [Methylobacterium sp. WL103]|uniref:hypothetical protein n=1 Tax=Methylobacterium sp. WL103 TaxID=2603891 RepID=UPI0011DC3292|nr:hypothetical protein [Methylobacterium sp. WL103]TXN03427.1 hypothetical protein FV222_08555 [Methylobacterium sp. WL103]